MLARYTHTIQEINGVPTDTFRVAHDTKDPHTIFVFVPGNPGLVDFYRDLFVQLIDRLGPGYEARGASYVGHSIEQPVAVHDETLAWTIDGQSWQQYCFVQTLPTEPKLIFIAHSIGCHLTQRILVWKPELLERTTQIMFLMPFIRLGTEESIQSVKRAVAGRPRLSHFVAKTALQLLSAVPYSVLDRMLTYSMPAGRDVTIRLLQQPAFAANFLGLGLEEIRDVPLAWDLPGLRILTRGCPLSMLYAGKDHWAPESHLADLPPGLRVSVECDRSLQHDFVIQPTQVDKIVDWVVRQVVPRQSKL